MSEPRSAEIIRFPARVSTEARAPSQGLERLSRAMAALDIELAAQRRAVAEWREALADLKGSVRGMGESVQAYHGYLGTLDTQVAALRAGAERLAR